MYSKFPPEVLASSSVMDTLSLCATRIEHMQVYNIQYNIQYRYIIYSIQVYNIQRYTLLIVYMYVLMNECSF